MCLENVISKFYSLSGNVSFSITSGQTSYAVVRLGPTLFDLSLPNYSFSPNFRDRRPPPFGNPGSATELFFERVRALTYWQQTVPGRSEAAAAEAPVQLGYRVLQQPVYGRDVVTQAWVVHVFHSVQILKVHLKHSKRKCAP